MQRGTGVIRCSCMILVLSCTWVVRVVVARVDGPGRVVPPVSSEPEVEVLTLLGEGVHAALDVDAESAEQGINAYLTPRAQP